jgi:Arc/MetJ-type ribon-helix-helix transcriptional regulator
MQVTLTPETAEMVEQRLKDGNYASADELFQAAMLALDNQQFEPLDEETLIAIDEAEDDIERGDVFPLEEVEDQIRAMFAKGR